MFKIHAKVDDLKILTKKNVAIYVFLLYHNFLALCQPHNLKFRTLFRVNKNVQYTSQIRKVRLVYVFGVILLLPFIDLYACDSSFFFSCKIIHKIGSIVKRSMRRIV